MANSKLTGLIATTAPVSTDIFYIVTDPSGTPMSQKVTGANMGKALTLVGKVTITQPASSATLTIANGLTLNAGPGGTLTTIAFVTPGTGVATFLATPSSANLLAAVTDETGTGALTFATAPTFTTSINTPIVQSSTTLLLKTNGTTTALTLGTDQSATFASNVVVGTASLGGIVEINKSQNAATTVNIINPNSINVDAQAAIQLGQASTKTGGFFYLCDAYNAGAGFELLASTSMVFSSSTNVSNGMRFVVAHTTAPLIFATGGFATANEKLRLTSGGSLQATNLAANTSFLTSTGYSITGSGTTAMVNLAGTLSTSGVTDVITSNITNTVSGAGSTIINLKVGTVSQFKVGMTGDMTAAASVDTVLYKAGGTSGVANFGPSVVTSITVKGGIITAIS